MPCSARRCLDESETHLFEYVDTTGARCGITSSEVNQYLRDASGQDFTAKHFRTWGASVIALEALLTPDLPLTMKAMLEPVAAALGNTPTIARKSYVHPTVIELVSAPKKIDKMRRAMPRQAKFMSSGERMLLKLLTEHRTMQSGR